MSLDRRLRALGRQFGCHIHGEPIFCPACEVRAPLPTPLPTRIETLIDAIVARVGTEALRARLAPVPRPPTHEPCPRCGAARRCGACGEAYGRRLFAAVSLSPDEHARLSEILALCRALEP